MVFCSKRSGIPTGREGVVLIFKQCCLWKAMLLLLKCFDIKKVKSLNDLVIIDWVLGGEPTKKKKKKKKKSNDYIAGNGSF